MKNSELQKNVDFVLELVIDGDSKLKVKTKLKEKKISNSKSNEIIDYAILSLQNKYGYKIKQSLISGKPILGRFGLDEGLYQELRSKQEDYLKYSLMVEIKAKVIEKESNRMILHSLSGSVFSKDEIQATIEKEREEIATRIRGEQMGYILMSLLAFGGGLFLLVSLGEFSCDTTLPFVLGFLVLIKGLSMHPNEILEIQ